MDINKKEIIEELESFINNNNCPSDGKGICHGDMFKKILDILKEDNEESKPIYNKKMIKIRDYRGTGRTSRLILLAKETGAILVVPTCKMRDFVYTMAKRYGIEDVNVTTFNDFINHRSHDRNIKYIIDDLDLIMQSMYVIGYSDLKED